MSVLYIERERQKAIHSDQENRQTNLYQYFSIVFLNNSFGAAIGQWERVKKAIHNADYKFKIPWDMISTDTLNSMSPTAKKK